MHILSKVYEAGFKGNIPPRMTNILIFISDIRSSVAKELSFNDFLD